MASDDFIRAAAAFHANPSSRNLDGVRKYVSILETALQTDAAVVGSVASSMGRISNAAADVLKELGGKAPVSWQLVAILRGVCARSEQARVKAGENRYLLSILAQLFDSPEWPPAEVASLAELVAMLAVGVEVGGSDDFFAVALMRAAYDRLETASAVFDDDTAAGDGDGETTVRDDADVANDERVACLAGLVLLSLLEANPCLGKHVSALFVERAVKRLKSRLAALVAAGLRRYLAPDAADGVPVAVAAKGKDKDRSGDGWSELLSALPLRQWCESAAAASLASVSAVAVSADVCGALWKMDWVGCPGICVQSALAALEKVAGRDPAGHAHLWPVAMRALEVPGFQAHGFRLAAVSCRGTPPDVVDGGLSLCWEALRKVCCASESSGSSINPDEILAAVDLVEAVCETRKLDPAAVKKVAAGVRCYMSPDLGKAAVGSLALDASAAAGSSLSSSRSAAALTRLLAVAYRHFDDAAWTGVLDKLTRKDAVVAAVRRVLGRPPDERAFEDAFYVVERARRCNQVSGVYGMWRAAAERERTDAEANGFVLGDGFVGVHSFLSANAGSLRNSSSSNDSGLQLNEPQRYDKNVSADVVEIISAYEEKLKRQKAQMAHLQAEVSWLQARIGRLNRESFNDLDESATFRELLMNARCKLNRAERALRENKRNSEEARAEERAKFSEEKEALLKVTAERDEQIRGLDARLATTTSERDAAELARKSLAEELKKVQDEKAELCGKLKRSEEQNKEFREGVRRAEKKIDAQDKKINEYVRDVQDLKTKCEENGKAVKRLETELATTEKLLEEKNAEIADLQTFRAAILNVAQNKTSNR